MAVSVTTTGAEFRDFIADKAFWTGDKFSHGVCLFVDGKPVTELAIRAIPTGAEVEVENGYVMGNDYDKTLSEAFTDWRNKRVCKTLVVEVRPHLMDAVLSAISSAGGIVKA